MNDPALWAKSNSITRLFAVDLSEEYENELGKMSGRCIDVGSGPCDVTVDLVLPKLNPSATIVCSDISDSMMEYAKEKYKDNKRVSFLTLDIETPDLPKDLIEQFDHATSYYCLHWCQDMQQVFENLFNLLHPGGTVLSTFIVHFPGMNSYKELAAMPRYQPYMKDMDRYLPVFQHTEQPRKILKSLIENVGFEVRHCSIREKTYTFDNIESLRGSIVAGNPFLIRMPADLKKDYENDLARAFARHSIILNKTNDREDDYSILFILRTVVLYLRKPMIEKNSN